MKNRKAESKRQKAIHPEILVLHADTITYPGYGLETMVGREKATDFYSFAQSVKGDDG